MKKKFKLNLNHFFSVDIPFTKQKEKNRFFTIFYHVGLIVFNSLKKLGLLLFHLCFFTGSFLISLPRNIYSFASNQNKLHKILFRDIQNKLFNLNFVKSLAFFGVLIIFGIFGFKSLDLAAKAIKIKNEVINSSFLGRKYLADAKTELENQKLEQAQNNLVLAYNSFAQSQKQFEKTGDVVNRLANIIPQKRDAERLLKSAKLFSKSGIEMLEFYKLISGIEFSSEGLSYRNEPKNLYFKANEYLRKISRNIKEIEKDISKINPQSLPWQFRGDFIKIQSQFTNLKIAFSNLREITSLISALTEGKKNILVLFQNNNELRPTGGFIGSYGSIQIDYGRIKKMEISSVYDLDGQLQENIAPPKPILNINDRWFLRDSNWFADFKQSAKEIISFYEKEGKETPETVIALTPSVIVDLLKILGPVTLPTYDLTLTDENFIEVTQIRTSGIYSDPENKPKQILADLVPVLLQKISKMDPKLWPNLLESLQKNLSSKQIAFYSNNSNLQDKFEALNWAGRIQDTDRDYLLIVNSNLGGTKTDLFVDQKVNLTSTIGEDGKIVDELTIYRKNNMPKIKNAKNTSFIRIFVPQGSTLISNSGFSYKNLKKVNSGNQKIDKDVFKWEKSLVEDVISGTLIGTESGKTFFGNWSEIEGGQEQIIKLKYKLPFKLKNVDRYSLLVQKQLGAKANEFNYQVNFSGRKIEYSNLESSNIQTNKLNTKITLNKDYLLGLVFSLR